MNNFRHNIVVATGLAVLAALGTQQASAEKAEVDEVRVVNTTPIPVTGTVSGTVGLAPGASVVVSNTAANPVKVTSVASAPQPFQYGGLCNVTGAGSFGLSCIIPSFTVPAGKLLVIEYASAGGCVPAGQIVRLNIGTSVTGLYAFSIFHDLTPTPPASTPTATSACNGAGTSRTMSGQTVRLYASPGTSVSLSLARNADVGSGNFDAQISGHFEDVP